MTRARICRDCVWFIPDNSHCGHDRATNVDLVTGAEHQWSAFQMRTWPCGPDGKLWQAFPQTMEEIEDSGQDPF